MTAGGVAAVVGAPAVQDGGARLDRRAARGSRLVPLALGAAATLLTATGLSGLGDAPDPKAPAAEIGRYFVEQRDDVLAAAPFGYVGAIALLGFALHLAARLRSAGRRPAATSVVVGGALCAAYFVGLHLVLTTIAYEVAATSASSAKALFVGTILAAPVLGAGVAALLGGLAWGDRAAELVPRWLVVASAAGAVVGLTALAAFGQSGLLSPDVQQQVTGNIALLWPLVTGAALAWRAGPVPRRASRGTRAPAPPGAGGS